MRVPMFALLAFLWVLPQATTHAQKKFPTPASWCSKENPGSLSEARLWRDVLKRHTYKGKFDYDGLRRHSMPILRGYLCQVSRANVASLSSRNAKLAFWLNAYNAITLRAVLERLPEEQTGQKLFSVMGIKQFWKHRYQVAGRWLSLDEIENKIIRPQFRDPRIHFALASASQGGPDVWPVPLQPKKLARQLSAATKRYLRSPRALRIDRRGKKIWLSKIFQWYRKDFAETPQKNDELSFIAKYTNTADAVWLQRNWKKVSIQYLNFKWKLNAITAPEHQLYQDRHMLWNKLLKAHVRDGWLDYNGVRERAMPWLKQYLAWLAKANPQQWPSRNDKLAFWLNAYNAALLHQVLEELPNNKTGQTLFSVMSIRNFWKAKHSIAGQRLSLNDIQHKILRPQFRDPRTHFALSSAARSGAGLASWAYEAATLNRQLEQRARRFLRSKRGLRIDRAGRKVWLSKIFEWYRKDFAGSSRRNAELAFVAKYAKNADATWLKANWTKASIQYINFNWKLDLPQKWARDVVAVAESTTPSPTPAAVPPARTTVAAVVARPEPRTAAPPTPAPVADPHAVFGKILRSYVRTGRVNYNGIRNRAMPAFKQYLAWVANTDLRSIQGRRAKMVFWINAYNAVTIQAVLEKLPKSRGAQSSFSVVKVNQFWKKKYRVANRWISLDAIENKVLRPRYGDPRIHFALVCASHGCPDLLSRHFTPANLYRLMNLNTRRYLRSPRAFRIDRAGNKVWISKIFQWYRKDFTSSSQPNTELAFIAKYIKKPDSTWLKANWNKVSIQYLPYSWKLNVQ